MRIVAIGALALLCVGRVTTECVRFQPTAEQEIDRPARPYAAN